MTQRIALVTGGIGGIGTAICIELRKQDRLVVAGHLPEEEEIAGLWQSEMRVNGYNVELAAGDVADFESTRSMIRQIKQRFGTIGILVNCAGITRDAFLAKMDPEDWLDVINTNLNSVFNVTRQVIPDMISSGFGRIVNISSVNGQKGQFGQTNYSAAKAGMHGFTMALAQEGARKGVTVNSVSPGYVETRMTAAVNKDILNAIIKTIPMGRLGTAREIAQAVGFLCLDETSYVTGVNLPVNGGLYMG
jgi:acetoacetyl-CoA reductase